MAEHAEDFENQNARLIVIGSGEPRYFPEFQEETGYDGLLYTDPSLALFSFLGFSSGVTGLMSIRSALKAAFALKNGHRQGSIQGSTLQLGGAVVIDASNALQYYFAGKKAGDHPRISELLSAVRSN